MSDSPLKIIEFPFATVEFYSCYMVSTYKEGIVLTDDDVLQLQAFASQFYGEKRFAYISNRVHDYSRNLVAESYNRQLENLSAFAVVCHSETAFRVANFEKFFIRAPFKSFTSLNSAKSWVLMDQP